MDELLRRLIEAIDESERIARYVMSDYALHGPDWSVLSTGVVDIVDDLVPVGDGPLAEYIAHHDPAATLRRCAADRYLVDELSGMARRADSSSDALDALAALVISKLAESYGIEES